MRNYGRTDIDTRAKPTRWDKETPKGTYILCPHGKCKEWVWYDKAKNSCKGCGTPYNFKKFWDDLKAEGNGGESIVAVECPAGVDGTPVLDTAMDPGGGTQEGCSSCRRQGSRETVGEKPNS